MVALWFFYVHLGTSRCWYDGLFLKLVLSVGVRGSFRAAQIGADPSVTGRETENIGGGDAAASGPLGLPGPTVSTALRRSARTTGEHLREGVNLFFLSFPSCRG